MTRLLWTIATAAFTPIPALLALAYPNLATPAADPVLDAASTYVLEYERQLTSIVADETYSQEIRQQVPRIDGAPRSRRMKGEIFFMFMPGDRTWMAIREPREVDGETIAEGPRVRDELRTLAPHQVGARMRAANAEWNIGRVTRNFNEPTLALLTLDPRHRSRFRFDVRRPRRADGSTVVPIEFEERERPTLITGNGREPVFVKGVLEVDPVNGSIRRSVLTASVSTVRLELVTEYAFDVRLRMFLPHVFRERYEEGNSAAVSRTDQASPSRGYELILCEARYANYRRFETSIRIR